MLAMPGYNPKCAAMSYPFWVVLIPNVIAAGRRPLPTFDTLLPLADPVQAPPTVSIFWAELADCQLE